MVDDDEPFRDALVSTLDSSSWQPIFAASGEEALALLGDTGRPPAVALVDPGLPGVDGGALLGRLVARRPELPIVVLTACTENRRILEAIRLGARGYIFKEDLGRGLESALNEAFAGGAPMSRAVTRLLLDELRRDPAGVDPKPPRLLTEREREVVEQLARGLSYEQVGAVLDVSSNTVRTYVRAIYRKLSVCSKTEAVLAALRLGIIKDDRTLHGE